LLGEFEFSFYLPLAHVFSDAPSFEMAPLVGDHNKPGGIWKGEEWEGDMQGGGLLHQWLLGGWGVMIGEMWDLERLCEKAEELGRWTCFVSSVPLKASIQIIKVLLLTKTNESIGTRRSCESAKCCRNILGCLVNGCGNDCT
jgi:hypothetical protein